MKTIQQSTAINAIRNYVYFTYNFPQPDEFIRSCWAGDKVMADHLLEKLRSYNYWQSGTVCRMDLRILSRCSQRDGREAHHH